MTPPLRTLLRRHRWTALTAGAVLLFLAVLVSVIGPRLRMLTERLDAWLEQRHQLAASGGWDREHATLTERHRALTAHYETLQVHLPARNTTSPVLGVLQEGADTTGVRLHTIRPADRVAHARYDERPFQLELEGSFSALAAFIDHVERSRYVMKVKQLHLTRSAPPLSTLRADLLLHLIVLKEPSSSGS